MGRSGRSREAGAALFFVPAGTEVVVSLRCGVSPGTVLAMPSLPVEGNGFALLRWPS